MDMEIRRLIKDSSLQNVVWVLAGASVVIAMGLAIAYEEWMYLVFLSIPPLFYFSMIKPFLFPLGVYLFLIPFDSILSVTGSSKGTTLTKLLGIVTILIFALKGSFERKLQMPNKAAYYWTFLGVFGLVSILWAMNSDSAISKLSTVFGLLVLYLVISSYKVDVEEFETCKWFILSGGFLCSIFAVYGYSAGMFYKSTSRATISLDDRTSDPNHFAFSLLIPISLSIEKIFGQQNWKIKILLSVILGIMIFSIIISGSRGGLLGVLTIFIVYISLMKKRTALTVLTILMGVVLVLLSPDLFFERLDNTLETGGTGRMTIWTYGLDIFKTNWLYGVGLNNFPKAYAEFGHFTPFTQAIYRAAHNIYLEILVELGIIGFAVMVLSIVKHYKLLTLQHHHRDDINQTMLKASMLGVLVSSFSLGTIWTKSFWLLWMMILIYTNVTERRHNPYDKRISQTRNW